MSPLNKLAIKIFADGADVAGMRHLYANPLVKGITTNPTLMRQAGIESYEAFAREVLETVVGKPISFEVFSDEFGEMHRQALKINSWQNNVFVKIPITNTKGESSLPLMRELVAEGVKINATALLTLDQVKGVSEVLRPDLPSVVSVFAGRIADTGRDPAPTMVQSLEILRDLPSAELLWASCREVLNIFQANNCGVPIITVTHDLLKKALILAGNDLDELSLSTVKMFHDDAKSAGYSI